MVKRKIIFKKLIFIPPINKKLLTKDTNAGKRWAIAIMAGIISMIILIKFKNAIISIYLIIAVLIISIIVRYVLYPKCSRDGLKLMKWKIEEGSVYYRCSKGHIYRISNSIG